MFQNSKSSDRRILTFPAVHPCEAISPATLLASLIDLCRQICNHQLKTFVTQKRNARETIRQIGILLIFFEELRDMSSDVLPDSVVLCFSELHLTFQKILFLFEDCSRSNAKIWILMKSQFVATQFWVLIRALATALDVLPLNRIDTSDEVKELVELVVKQARISKFGLDKDDELMMKRLQSILLQFEKGIEPDLTAIKRVLSYLEIRRWSDCNKEIKFLEEEIDFQYSDLKERDVQILSSLVGFMSYSRLTLFEALDFWDKNQTDIKCNPETLSCLNPQDFRCPISLELMIDPVTVSTGQTYDRASIQKWLSAGNLLCPKTGERLTSSELVPNTSLKKLIHQFCVDNGISLAKFNARSHDITRTIIPGSPAAAEAMKFSSEYLLRRLVFGTDTEKNKAAYEIRLLAKSNIFNRSCLIKVGIIPSLLNLLSSLDKSTQENAIAAVLKLSKHSTGKILVVENGGLVPILSVLKSGFCLESRQLAAATLFYLSSVKEYRKLIGETPDAITGLIELIKEGTTCGKKNAVVAIFGLLLYPKNNKTVLNSGVVPILLDIIATSVNDELISDSLAVIAALAESSEGSNTILHASALPLLIRTLNSATSSPGKEYCVSALRSLCNHGGEEVVATLAGDRSIAGSLYSIVTEGSAAAGKKARSLLKILHKFRENDVGVNSAVDQERSVRVW
ncbi:U-box domain-containing protein 19-like [Cucurbita pepo subsp. pepo]|uniref:U-box domain-containing protein 19-like n=1 Tax=Cucurbita pepo subsp. pepo TaxID=3664 RepID=UPI000C9D6345|nr:U-box domain-containing protein 19-like [Cucurbita pepo subsp. pepo]